MGTPETPCRLVKLAVENELRLVVGNQGDIVRVQLVTGKAEIFGTEMRVGQVYPFPPNSSVAVYTWHGCELKVSGKVEVIHVEKENQSMILNCVLHSMLEERRCIAELEQTKGPRTLIVGPTDVGKSTLCRYLLNYASRMGRVPVYIDLDVGQNAISVPGSMCIAPIQKPADIVRGFEEEGVLVYQFGYKSPGHNLKLYFLILKELAEYIKTSILAPGNVFTSGLIINTCGWVRSHGYCAITFAAVLLEIDILCVIGEERLYNQLKQDMPSCVEIIFIPKLEGVIERSRPLRISARDARVREYFYGSFNTVRRHSFEITYSDIQVLRASRTHVGDGDFDQLTNVTLSDISILAVPLGPNLLYQVLALSSADNVCENILLTNVIGFICVCAVDMSRGVISILSPQPSPLPHKILIMGDIRGDFMFQ